MIQKIFFDKRYLGVFIFLYIALFSGTIIVDAKNNDYTTMQSQVNDYAQDKVTAQFDYWIDLLWDESGDKLTEKKENAVLGSPFIYYDPSQADYQNASFYYPVVVKDEIVGVIHAVFYDGNWTLSVTDTDNDFKKLNEFDYLKTEALFYVVGNQVMMETEEAAVPFTSLIEDRKNTKAQQKFSKLSYREKWKEIVQNTRKFEEEGQTEEISEKINLKYPFSIIVLIFVGFAVFHWVAKTGRKKYE